MIKDEEERLENEEKQESKIPWLSIMIAGSSYYIYSRWINWNYLRAQRAFVFSETNFLKNKNYHSLLFQPISFESEFGFYTKPTCRRCSMQAFWWKGISGYSFSREPIQQTLYYPSVTKLYTNAKSDTANIKEGVEWQTITETSLYFSIDFSQLLFKITRQSKGLTWLRHFTSITF